MGDYIIAPSVELLESMRSVGYSLTAALADIVDNSISAGATNIEIDVDTVEGKWVAILDDGSGMSTLTAVEALRLAGSTGVRPQGDLGRFGLGLKTASLSQGRKLSVITKQADELTALCWDIDHVMASQAWALQNLSTQSISQMPFANALKEQESGTLVVWEQLDLLLGDAVDRAAHLRELVSESNRELALIFHQYLSASSRKLTISINGKNLVPIDPFLENYQKTQKSPAEDIFIGGERVQVTAYTLPHASDIKHIDKKRVDLGSKMRDFQGFYVYRNKRLISYGDWFGLIAKSEITKQTRIKIELPTTIDHLWQLDIKKSRATPPASFRARFKKIIDNYVQRGKRVHTFRGRREVSTDVTRIWEKEDFRDGFRYSLNFDHPLLATVVKSMKENEKIHLQTYLRFVEDTYPVHDLYSHMAQNQSPNSEESIVDDYDALLSALKNLLSSGFLPAEKDHLKIALSEIHPFNSSNHLDKLVEQVTKAS